MTTNFLTKKKDITAWLKRHNITNYTLISEEHYGFVVNVRGEVNLSGQKLTEIKVKFHLFSGDFNCSDNQLTSLEFCPTTVEGSFHCSNNLLTSLEGCPVAVKENFNCANNQLTSLKFCPQEVGWNFQCSNNQLTSLEFAPTTVKRNFICSNNQLTSLEHCPNEVYGYFNCAFNQLRSLEFFPTQVGIFLSSPKELNFICDNNPELGEIQNLTNFKEIYPYHKKIADIKKEQQKLSQNIGKISKKNENEQIKFKL